MAGYNAYLQSNISYVPGSAAPKLNPVPVAEPAEREKKQSKAPAKSYARIYMPAFCVMVIMLLGLTASIVWQLSVTASITASQEKIESTLSKLNTLTADNDAQEIYMNKSVDLNQIYEIATEQLGMVYPSYDQIVYYTRKDSGYVRQYEDIPQN